MQVTTTVGKHTFFSHITFHTRRYETHVDTRTCLNAVTASQETPVIRARKSQKKKEKRKKK